MHRLLKLLAKRIGEQDERLQIKEIIPVGSAKEGTQIIRPCEYDCIFTLCNLSKPGVVSIRPTNMNVSRRDYVFVMIENDETRSAFQEILTVNGDVRSRYLLNLSSKLDNPCRRNELRNLLSNRSGLRRMWWTRRGLRDLFFSAIHKSIISCSESTVQMSTGILRFIVAKPEEHGPAFTIKLLWERESTLNQLPMEISVDVVPVLKLPWEMYNNLLTEVEEFVVNYFDHVRSVGSFFLMPRDELKFHVNFTEAELYHMENLSDHHKKCYKPLKYMLNGEPFPLERCTSRLQRLLNQFTHTDTLFHSYSLKLVV